MHITPSIIRNKARRITQNVSAIKKLAEYLKRTLLQQDLSKRERHKELIIANKELAFQNEEKEKRAAELLIANKELKEAEEHLKKYVQGLEEMMFMTSHKVRRPIASILGLSELLEQSINSPDKLKELIDHIKKSALSLDTFTKELTEFMSDLEKKERNKN